MQQIIEKIQHKKRRHEVIIVGGGAAGFFAAITCAEANPKAKVTILERGKEVLGKVKISGGGRCNVTHACWMPRELVKNYPRGAKELMGPFNTFCTGDTVEWFEKRKVELKIEEDGRMFPVTDSSQTIMDCLMKSAQKAGVQLITQTNIQHIYPPEEAGQRWKLLSAKGEAYHADRVMMATGSSPKVWNMIAHLGHKIVPPVPSLFTFNIKDKRIKSLLGISVPKALIKVNGVKLKAEGPLLITHWGMSGPAILKLSAWGARELNDRNYQFQITVNWLGVWRFNDVIEELQEIREKHPKKKVHTNPQFGIPSRLWARFCEAAAIPADRIWVDTGKKIWNKLATQLVQAEFQVNGKSTFKEEFVTAGGVDLKEINFKDFSSKIFPSLHFAGEALNIDAITGGFNFQAAWTGGFIAGNALAKPVE